MSDENFESKIVNDEKKQSMNWKTYKVCHGKGGFMVVKAESEEKACKIYYQSIMDITGLPKERIANVVKVELINKDYKEWFGY